MFRFTYLCASGLGCECVCVCVCGLQFGQVYPLSKIIKLYQVLPRTIRRQELSILNINQKYLERLLSIGAKKTTLPALILQSLSIQSPIQGSVSYFCSTLFYFIINATFWTNLDCPFFLFYFCIKLLWLYIHCLISSSKNMIADSFLSH